MPSLASVSYFTQKLVEKIYSGVFSADPRHILLFITEHIIAVRSCVHRAIRSIPWMDWESPSASLIFLPGVEIESKTDEKERKLCKGQACLRAPAYPEAWSLRPGPFSCLLQSTPTALNCGSGSERCRQDGDEALSPNSQQSISKWNSTAEKCSTSCSTLREPN